MSSEDGLIPPYIGNGSSLSVKDLVLRLDGKLDAFIVANQNKQERQDAAIGNVSGRVAVLEHLSAQRDEEHHKIQNSLDDMRDWQNRKQGNFDVVRGIFGTSILAVLVSMSGVVVAIIALLK